jgi:hypothetical protein
MFCPNCGTTISTAQSYCRACGLGLEKIAQSVAEQRPTEFQESVQQRKERIERWGVAALSVFGGGLLIVTLYHIVKMMIEGRVWAGVGYLALLLLLCCGIISVILFAMANEIGSNKVKGAPAPSESIPASTANLLPPEALDSMPSVTESTTELLPREKKVND